MTGSGRFGIGSDSNISVSPVEELRWLEYGQRLITNRRNISATGAEPHVGKFLWVNAASGGARALGRNHYNPGAEDSPDLIVLDEDHPYCTANLHRKLLIHLSSAATTTW